MTRVEQVARDALGSVGTADAFLLAVRWVSLRYQEACGLRRLRHLRRTAELLIPAPITAGLVTVSPGDDTVVGDATAQAAWTAMGDSLDAKLWQVRLATTWYDVRGLGDAASLRLASFYTEAAVADGAYTLVRRRHPLATDVRLVGEIVSPRRRLHLDLVNREWLERQEPERRFVASYGPVVYTEREPAISGGDTTKCLEVYPPPTADELLAYTYYARPPDLGIDDVLPAAIDPLKLREGVLIDVYRWKMAKALDANQPEVGATWRNEAARQESVWRERVVGEVAVADIATDDVAVLLQQFPPRAYPEIRTARDHVWAGY